MTKKNQPDLFMSEKRPGNATEGENQEIPKSESVPVTIKGTSSDGGSMRTLPYIFATIAGVIYGVGFLVEFTFLSSFGIQDTGAEAFKAKYIYVGLLCLQFPVSITVVTLGYIKVMRTLAKHHEQAKMDDLSAYKASLFMLLNLLFAFSLLISFARPGLYHERDGLILTMFALMIIGLSLARGIEEKVSYQRRTNRRIGRLMNILKLTDESCRRLWSTLRWILLGFSCVLTIIVFWSVGNIPNTWLIVGEMLTEGGWVHYALLFLAALMLFRIQKSAEKYANLNLKSTVSAIGFTIAGVLSYLSIMWFAYRVYPYIPAGRGGGDFTAEKPSIITFESKYIDSIPKAMRNEKPDEYRSKPVLILHESGSMVYATLQTDAAKWRMSGRINKPSVIYSIKKDAVVAIQFDN